MARGWSSRAEDPQLSPHPSGWVPAPWGVPWVLTGPAGAGTSPSPSRAARSRGRGKASRSCPGKTHGAAGPAGGETKIVQGSGQAVQPPNPGQAVQPRYRYKINTWIDTRSIPGLKPPGCFCPHPRPRPHLVKFAQLQGPAPIQVEAGAQRGAGHLLWVGRRGLGAPRLCHGGGSWAV